MGAGQPPKLRDQVCEIMEKKNFSPNTQISFWNWIKRFILFNGTRHPSTLHEPDVSNFLSHLALTLNVSPSTQNQALCAIVFLYKHVLGTPLGIFPGIVWAQHQRRLPVVLTRVEVNTVLAHPHRVESLSVLYGAGLRLKECIRLRIKDVDLTRQTITVREAKGDKDRVTLLPVTLIQRISRQMHSVRAIHQRDLALGFGEASLPSALERKNPNALKEFGWQYLFFSSRRSEIPLGRKIPPASHR